MAVSCEAEVSADADVRGEQSSALHAHQIMSGTGSCSTQAEREERQLSQ